MTSSFFLQNGHGFIPCWNCVTLVSIHRVYIGNIPNNFHGLGMNARYHEFCHVFSALPYCQSVMNIIDIVAIGRNVAWGRFGLRHGGYGKIYEFWIVKRRLDMEASDRHVVFHNEG